MASLTDDLRSFLENRLLAFDPTIDLSPGSPAQSQIIDAVLARVAEDPFDIDMSTFIRDRMFQEFPDLMADNGGLLEDILTKPMQLLLEPFKRAIQDLRLNQSVANAALLSDDAADALGANWFEPRQEGDFSGGPVRVYFAAPTSTRITTDRALNTNSGLRFFPTENFNATAAQMAFNQEGTQFFVEITVRAEKPGTDYNVDVGAISGIQGISGVIRVSNPSRFTSGIPRETNEEYLGRFDSVLTERSLVTSRGAIARSRNLFESLRALQVVGAGETGMNRDVLTGTGEGFLHLVGPAALYGNWLFISAVTWKDDGPANNIVIQAGDTVRFQVPVTVDPTLTVYTAFITDVFSSGVGTALEKYLLILDSTPTLSMSPPPTGSAAVLKAGFITISNIPGGTTQDIVVPDGQVHLGGHEDIFARPSADVELRSVLATVTDAEPVLAVLDLAILSAASPNANRVTSAGSNFVASGVRKGDILVIETGTDQAGTYVILSVGTPDFSADSNSQLRVNKNFTATASGLRARIVRSVTVDLVEPKTPKLPFNTGAVSDLRTVVGSELFRFDTNNIQNFGAVVGDIIRVLDGPDAGDFTIKSFDPILGGQGAVVDRTAGASGANLRYEVFTQFTGLTRPIVRVKSLEILDSTNQGTGITVPYGDAVDVRPTCNFEGAGHEVQVLDNQILILPDTASLWGNAGSTVGPFLLADDPATPGANTDARFSQNIEVADGIIRKFSADVSNPISTFEVNLPPFMWNGRRDKFLAFTTRLDTDFTVDITGAHRTSDVAKAKVGYTVTLLDGPNRGSYLIRDIRIIDAWGKTAHGHYEVALVQVDREFPVDPIRTAMRFIVAEGTGAVSATDLLKIIEYSTDSWDPNSSSFWSTFNTKLNTALAAASVTFTIADLKALMAKLARTGYAVGPAASGILRTYFQSPVSAEFFFGEDDATVMQAILDPSKRFRLDFRIPAAQIMPESEEETPPQQWNRNTVIEAEVADPRYVALVSGSSFVKRGVRTGDVLEFYAAVDDTVSRGIMESSWLAVTQAGSNVVQLVMPRNINNLSMDRLGGPFTLIFRENPQSVIPGMLAFIDSGPDVGAYLVTKVLPGQDFTVNPPIVQIQLDKLLSHSTLPFPALATLDFENNGMPAVLNSAPNTFPMTFAGGETLKIKRSSLAGTSFNLATATHTFLAATHANMAALIAALTTGSSWGGAGPAAVGLAISSAVNSLNIRSTTAGPEIALNVDLTSTALGAGKINGFSGGENAWGAGGFFDVGAKRIYAYGLSAALVGDWISAYAASSEDILIAGEDASFLGTFKITAAAVETVGPNTGIPFVQIDRTGGSSSAGIRWIRHTAPDSIPSITEDGGTVLTTQFVRIRLYDSVPKTRKVTVDWAQDALQDYVLPGSLGGVGAHQILLNKSLATQAFAHRVPYRITRKSVKRISSTAMVKKRLGALYFVDLPVLGYGPSADMNIAEDTALFLTGRADIAGYTLLVNDENYTFSDQEKLSIVLPSAILPVGSSPDLDNEIRLAGQNLQVIYNNAPLIADLQRFFGSPLDRTVVANALVRHFLPSYVFLDATYTGGSSESVVAKVLIDYLNNIPPNVNEIQVDQLISLIEHKSASGVQLPITVIAVTHGIDRKLRAMRSENAIGGSAPPLFKGSQKQSFFIAGPDTSAEQVRPDGEQVFLKRL